MTAVDLGTDIEVLVGELPIISCEHQAHGDDPVAHADGNEHYLRVKLPNCTCQDGVFVYCMRYIEYLLSIKFEVNCSLCRQPFHMKDGLTILGPANK